MIQQKTAIQIKYEQEKVKYDSIQRSWLTHNGFKEFESSSAQSREDAKKAINLVYWTRVGFRSNLRPFFFPRVKDVSFKGFVLPISALQERFRNKYNIMDAVSLARDGKYISSIELLEQRPQDFLEFINYTCECQENFGVYDPSLDIDFIEIAKRDKLRGIAAIVKANLTATVKEKLEILYSDKRYISISSNDGTFRFAHHGAYSIHDPEIKSMLDNVNQNFEEVNEVIKLMGLKTRRLYD